MRAIKPVTVKNASFNFCKYGVSLLLWLGFLLKLKLLLILAALILGSSAVLGVNRAPMIVLGDFLFGSWLKSLDVMLDFNGMRFAHAMGFVLNLIAITLVFLVPTIGWKVVLFVAILKTISALGYCSGLKLYQCMHNDKCCRNIKSLRR